MKIAAIGDTHGKNIWKKIVKKAKADLTVFIGDYFDSFDVSPEEQLKNFRSILDFKRKNLNNVVLLIGNHDYHYLKNVKETYSGFNAKFSKDCQDLLEEAISEKLMKVCHVSEKYIFSHAGFSKTWCKKHIGNENPFGETFEQVVNDYFISNRNAFGFSVGPNLSNTGADITQGPFWIRPESLLTDVVENCIQVVGHTKQPHIINFGNLILIDVLDYQETFLCIEDGSLWEAHLK